MPIYEYECEKCGRVLEAYQKFSDPALRNCKACSGKLHKLVSQSSFHLKGTGWYVTDYGNKRSDTAQAKKQKSDKPAAEKTDKTKTDSTSPKKKEA